MDELNMVMFKYGKHGDVQAKPQCLYPKKTIH